ncbi:MAG: MerR family transcriptional regulator [Thermomicrobiales bacterium]
MTLLTIREAAERTGLTAHTLRFYERIGLLEPIQRGTGGHRRYREQDLGWIRLLICLRKSGMPIRALTKFATLQRDGDPTGEQRKTLLEQHRRDALAHIEEISTHLAVIEKKLASFDQLRQTWDTSTETNPARTQPIMEKTR